MSDIFKKILFHKEKFLGGASILTAATFVSYILGLIRDRLFARTFGAGRELDIYNAAFNIPDLMVNILVAGALSAAFIPIFTSAITNKDKEEAARFGSTVINFSVLIILIFGSLAFIFMPYLAHLIAPGFSSEDLQRLIPQSRILIFASLIFTLSYSFGGILLSYKSYLAYALSPILYNLGIIIGALFASKFGITAVVFGTLGGAFIHMLIRFAGVLKSPFKYRPILRLNTPNFITFIKLMIPKTVGHPVEQLAFVFFTNIASFLAVGSVAVISFARNFQSVPVSLFGMAFSVAIFPMLCEAAAKKDSLLWRKYLKKTFKDILLFTIPAALLLIFLGKIPIQIFLGGGKFTADQIAKTGLVLSFFAIGIPTESLGHLLARAFYSTKDTLTPVLTNVFALIAMIVFAKTMTPHIDIIAIPIGFFLGNTLRMILLLILLPWRIKKAGMQKPI